MAELVTDFLENRLALRSRLDVRWHLLRCTACTRYFDQMRRTIGFLSEKPPPPPPPPSEVENRIVDRASRDR